MADYRKLLIIYTVNWKKVKIVAHGNSSLGLIVPVLVVHRSLRTENQKGDSCTWSQKYWLKMINQTWKRQSELPFILIIWAYVYIPWGDWSQKMNRSALVNPNRLQGRESQLGWEGKRQRFRSMAPDQWSIGRSHQYTSCWRSELWLHRWKWVGRARVWWWFMLEGQMCYFGERLCDRDAWMSLPGLRVREYFNIHTFGLMLVCRW